MSSTQIVELIDDRVKDLGPVLPAGSLAAKRLATRVMDQLGIPTRNNAFEVIEIEDLCEDRLSLALLEDEAEETSLRVEAWLVSQEGRCNSIQSVALDCIATDSTVSGDSDKLKREVERLLEIELTEAEEVSIFRICYLSKDERNTLAERLAFERGTITW